MVYHGFPFLYFGLAQRIGWQINSEGISKFQNGQLTKPTKFMFHLSAAKYINTQETPDNIEDREPNPANYTGEGRRRRRDGPKRKTAAMEMAMDIFRQRQKKNEKKHKKPRRRKGNGS